MSTSAYKMTEDNGTIRRIKKIIFETSIDSNEKLFTNEYAGDFAIRYIAYKLYLLGAKREKERKKKLANFIDLQTR